MNKINILWLINIDKDGNDLIKLGITPNKTEKEKFINFNDTDLQLAFLRGFFDADGLIRVSQRNGYQKSLYGIYRNLVLLKDILTFLQSEGFAENVRSITKKKGCYDIYVSSIKDLRAICNLLYQHGDIKLDRRIY